jgi:hypothetical protein
MFHLNLLVAQLLCPRIQYMQSQQVLQNYETTLVSIVAGSESQIQYVRGSFS